MKKINRSLFLFLLLTLFSVLFPKGFSSFGGFIDEQPFSVAYCVIENSEQEAQYVKFPSDTDFPDAENDFFDCFEFESEIKNDNDDVDDKIVDWKNLNQVFLPISLFLDFELNEDGVILPSIPFYILFHSWKSFSE